MIFITNIVLYITVHTAKIIFINYLRNVSIAVSNRLSKQCNFVGMGRVCMGRLGYGPSLQWAEFVMGRDVQLPLQLYILP